MSQKSKLAYLKILLNVKENAYQNNKELLKQDLTTLRNLLLIDSENQHMQRLEKCMVLSLNKH